MRKDQWTVPAKKLLEKIIDVLYSSYTNNAFIVEIAKGITILSKQNYLLYNMWQLDTNDHGNYTKLVSKLIRTGRYIRDKTKVNPYQWKIIMEASST